MATLLPLELLRNPDFLSKLVQNPEALNQVLAAQQAGQDPGSIAGAATQMGAGIGSAVAGAGPLAALPLAGGFLANKLFGGSKKPFDPKENAQSPVLNRQIPGFDQLSDEEKQQAVTRAALDQASLNAGPQRASVNYVRDPFMRDAHNLPMDGVAPQNPRLADWLRAQPEFQANPRITINDLPLERLATLPSGILSDDTKARLQAFIDDTKKQIAAKVTGAPSVTQQLNSVTPAIRGNNQPTNVSQMPIEYNSNGVGGYVNPNGGPRPLVAFIKPGSQAVSQIGNGVAGVVGNSSAARNDPRAPTGMTGRFNLNGALDKILKGGS